MQRLFFLAVLACSLVAGVLSCNGTDGESFVEVRGDRTKLIDPFESYESISIAQQRLKNSGFTWTVIENNATLAKGETRPPFHIYVIRVDNFSSRGVDGALRLEFFNDRMMATWFYPKNFSFYRTLLEKRYPKLRAGQAAIIDQYTRIEFGIDHEGHNYISWEDSRLREEFNLWIKRYS